MTRGVMARLRRVSVGEALRWSDADKCVLSSIAVYVLGGPYLVYSFFLLWNPRLALYVDRPFLARVFIPTFGVFLGGFFSIIIVALRRPHSGRLLGHVVGQLYGIGCCVIAYFLGFLTTPFFASTIIGGVAIGALLHGKGVAVWGALSALIVCSVAVVGEQMGLLLYGPVLREAPFTDGRLATSWLFGWGGIVSVQTLGVAFLIDVVARRLRLNKDSLADTSRELAETTAELSASNDELTRLYEDLRGAQTELVHSEKMASLGQLVAGIGHDLNNPISFLQGGLANLRGFLEELAAIIDACERCEITDHDTRRMLTEMRARLRLDYMLRETPALLEICAHGADRVKMIVDDLQIFARADRGQRIPTDVAKCIDEALDDLGPRLRDAGITVQREYVAAVPIPLDPGQFRLVWRNLSANAIDALAGRSDATLSISMRVCPGAQEEMDAVAEWLEVRVEDNGPGIDAQNLARVFDPFFTTKPVGQGTGLGLSIAFGVVQNHGGEIFIESRDGQGTCVIVRLPHPAAAG